MIGNPLLLGGGDYEISRSVRLRSSASAYFNRTPGSASNRRTWTWSGWVKRGLLGSSRTLFNGTAASASGTGTVIRFDSQYTDNTIHVFDFNSNAFTYQVNTAALLRDPSAWYHIVVAYDSTQATSTNRIKVFVNGIQQTLSGSYPSLNYDSFVNSTNPQYVGAENYGNAVITTTTLDGYLTEINFIDGQALTPSSFGETDAVTGVWKPKKYTGTYGTNGFYLNFSDNSNNTATTIGKDYSGNGNNWTPNNISVTSGATYDSMLDVPTAWADGGNGRGNYCTLNPLDAVGAAPTNGNLDWTGNSSGDGNIKATIAVSTGKWYAEFSNLASAAIPCVVTTTTSNTANSFPNQSGGYGYLADGRKANNGTYTSYGATFTSSDVIGVALDLDGGSVTFYKNGVSQGTAFTGLSGLFTFGVSDTTGAAITAAANFGQRPFAYTPPTGFKALHTGNLPEPTIKKGGSYFDIATWSGDNAVSRTITGAAFDPDLIWVKQRNGGGVHLLFDTVRSGGYNLQSQSTAAESTYGSLSAGGIASSATGGFTVAKGSVDSNYVNGTGGTYVAWQWKEGATPGFDIVTYTGNGTNRTIAHSLGVAPAMIIIKNRSQVATWIVGHQNMAASSPWNGFMQLNQTAAYTTSGGSLIWNNTAPTSSVFSVGTDTSTNFNGNNFVAYLFAEVAGFSKFGSYTGNGSSDGPFVFCGFRPRWVMTKRTDSTGSWLVVDSARNTYNVVNGYLVPNTSDAEGSATWGDFTANGFKLRGTTHNGSGESYIFAAFAENPFKYALAR